MKINKVIFSLIIFSNIIGDEMQKDISKEIKNVKAEEKTKIEIGSIWQHYKGKQYKIIATARYSENPDEIFVIYEAQYDEPTFGKNCIWARPMKMFLENVVIDGKEQPRFRKLN